MYVGSVFVVKVCVCMYVYVCDLKTAVCFVQWDLLVQLTLQRKILYKRRQLATSAYLFDDLPDGLEVFVVVSYRVWSNVDGAVDHCAVKDGYVGNVGGSASRV